MKTKELKIQIPKGMEIDKNNSTFECIRFKPIEIKPIEVKKTWENIGKFSGYFIEVGSSISNLYSYKTADVNRDVAASEKVAKSMLAMAQLSQVLKKWYEPVTENDFRNIFIKKWGIASEGVKCYVMQFYVSSLNTNFLVFRTKSDALEFLENNVELIKQYFML